MPRTVKATPEQLSYERLPGETSKAWQAFRIYRDLGPDRTHENTRLSLGKTSGYLRVLEEWSSKYSWAERAVLYDDWLDRMNRQEQEASIPRWEQHRQDALRANIELAAKLRERVQAMLEHPLTKERVEASNGRNVTYIVPANWTFSSIANMVKTMAELEAATIAEGLLDEENEAFDPTSATLEECREFIERQRRRSKVRPGTE